MAGGVRVAGIDCRVQGLHGFERVSLQHGVGFGQLGCLRREGGGLPAQCPRGSAHEHGEGEVEREEDEGDAGPDRMLVRRDQALAALRVRVDLVGTDRSAPGAVLDRRIDLEQPPEAEFALDRVLLGVRHFDSGDRLVASHRRAEASVEVEAVADPAACTVCPSEHAVRPPHLHGYDLRSAAKLVDQLS
jgi:hypothetical protein